MSHKGHNLSRYFAEVYEPSVHLPSVHERKAHDVGEYLDDLYNRFLLMLHRRLDSVLLAQSSPPTCSTSSLLPSPS